MVSNKTGGWSSMKGYGKGNREEKNGLKGQEREWVVRLTNDRNLIF